MTMMVKEVRKGLPSARPAIDRQHIFLYEENSSIYVSWPQCWGSITFWYVSGSGSRDPYLRLVDPDPNPTPDPTPFFIDFKDAKKYFLHIFLITYPQAHHLQSKKIKFFAKILFCGHHFSPLHTFMRKKGGSGSGSGSSSIPPTNGSGSGRPKNMRILRIRIPNTDWPST
jgi:hypothetical protein